MAPAIKVENLSKKYRLGLTHSGSIRELLNRCASRLFGHRSKEEPAYADASRVDESGSFWALKDINFEINAGEVVGIIGRNGAGKSTLLKILSRITLPSTGRIEMRGRVASLLEVGTGFHPELTGRENVYMNGTILGMTKQEIDRQFDAIVDFAGIETFIDTPIKRYSSGMSVRLGFAVAAHLNPEIIIVDEVLAVGDSEFQNKCIGRMQDVAAGGRTVLFVSHNMAAVQQLTKRCLVVNHGRIDVDSDTSAAISAYRQKDSGTQLGKYENRSQANGIRSIFIRTSHEDYHAFGESLEIEFTFHLAARIPQAGFSFQILDECDRPVSHYWILDPDQPLRTQSAAILMQCRIPNPRLYMGRYTLRTHLTDCRSGHSVEQLDGVCPFTVSMVHRHRSEYRWTSGAAVYLDDFEWRWRSIYSDAADASSRWTPLLKGLA